MRSFTDTWMRNFSWFALSLVVVPLLVGAAGYRFLRSYEAVATIWVEPQVSSQTAGDPWKPKTAADIYSSRLSQLLLTRSFREAVLQAVSGEIDGETRHEGLLQQVGKNAKVAAKGPYLVEVRFRDDNPVVARETAAAMVDGLQRQTLALKTEAIQRVADQYQQQLQQARDELAAAEAAKVDARALQSRVDLLRTIEERRNEAYGYELANTLAVPASLFVVDEARVPSKPSANIVQVLMGAAAALVITIVAQLAVVAALTITDHSVHNKSDVTPKVPALDVDRLFVRGKRNGRRSVVR